MIERQGLNSLLLNQKASTQATELLGSSTQKRSRGTLLDQEHLSGLIW